MYVAVSHHRHLCPAPCSMRRCLTFHRGGALSALGALWIITGILHIGLGTLLLANRESKMNILMLTRWSPVWLGGLFIFLGVCCVLAERYPRPGGVLLSGLLNLTAGVALSIAATVWYSVQIGDIGFWVNCEKSYWDRTASRRRHYDYDDNGIPANITMNDLVSMRQRCEEARGLMWALTYSVLAVLITLSILDLFLGLSSAILSFKSLKQGSSKNKPQLKETKATTE